MSARLGTRVTAGIFGVGLLLGSIASATAALPGALFSAGRPLTTPSPVVAAGRPVVTPADIVPSPAAGLLDRPVGQVNAAAPAVAPVQALPSLPSQVSDAVGPKVAPLLHQAGAAAPTLPALPLVTQASPPGAASLLGGLSPAGAASALPLPVQGLAPVESTLGQAHQLLGPLGPAVGAILNDTPLSATAGNGLAPLSKSLGTQVGGLPVNTGSATKGLVGSVAGQ